MHSCLQVKEGAQAGASWPVLAFESSDVFASELLNKAFGVSSRVAHIVKSVKQNITIQTLKDAFIWDAGPKDSCMNLSTGCALVSGITKSRLQIV